MRALARAALFVPVALVALTGCEDLREYTGTWSGEISADPNLVQGFAAKTTMLAEVKAVSRSSIALLLAFDPNAPPLTFMPIRRAAGDVLADVQLPGEPLRTYFGFVQPAGEVPLLTVVSLYPENRMEVRLMRGADDAYGVFSLRRVLRESPSGPTK